MIYFFKSILAHKNEDYSYDQLINGGLDAGLSISNKNMCCPDCVNGIYYLGYNQGLIDIYQELDNSSIRICCIEHSSFTETWANFKNAIGATLPCCNTDFNQAVQEWTMTSSITSPNYDLNAILGTGIFESSSFNGYSGLGILFNYLQLNFPELTAEDYLEILGATVKTGLVIQCYGCETIVASAPTYIDWLSNKQG